MNLVDEENGAVFVVVSCHSQDVSEFCGVGEYSIEAYHSGVGFGGDDFSQTGFAASRWSSQEDAAKLIVGN
jgi:hypothetical protein